MKSKKEGCLEARIENSVEPSSYQAERQPA